MGDSDERILLTSGGGYIIPTTGFAGAVSSFFSSATSPGIAVRR